MEVTADNNKSVHASGIEHIEYNFKCLKGTGIKAYQAELTLKQDRLINDLIKGLDKNLIKDITKIEFSRVLDILFQTALLDKLLNIVLNTNNVDYSDLTNSELEKVVTDFFTLNPSLKKWLGIGKTAPAGL